MRISGILSAAVVALGVAATAAEAADPVVYEPGTVTSRLPAVSGINGKLEGLGGWLDDDAIAGVGGSLSVPVPFIPIMGVQVDTFAGTWDDDPVYAGALHIFFRDPALGLLGAYGDWGYVSPEHYGRVGPELEIYFGRFSFEGIAGMAFGQNIETQWFDQVDIAWYPMDDLRLSVGHQYTTRGHMGAVGAEYLLPLNSPFGISLFAEGRAGEDDLYSAWGGLKIYAARERKSLIRRHREDDPRNRLPANILSITNCGQTYADGAFCGRDEDLDILEDGTVRNPSPVVASDRRLKTDIVRLATLADGLGLYGYRYAGGSEPQIGVMAQQVRLVRPDAVVSDGRYLAVDYGALFADPAMRASLSAAGFALDL